MFNVEPLIQNFSNMFYYYKDVSHKNRNLYINFVWDLTWPYVWFMNDQNFKYLSPSNLISLNL